jgi:uncharacterized protein (TIGR02145 family)
MKQKLFFLALTLLFLSVTSMNAQVQIGGSAGPNSSAILDLNPDEGDATLGLKLPVIALGDVSVFQLSGPAEDADGITVYNSSDETIGGSGKGLYVWEGKWVFTARSAPVDVPVTRITITSEDDVTVVNPSGDGLQLTATVEPANASNKTLRWTILYDPSLTAGYATIDQNGLITGVKPGSVTARASATDDFGAYRNFTFVVQPIGLAEKVTVRSETGITYVEVGKMLQLGADIDPIEAYQGVSWSIDVGSSEFASISPAGLLTGIALGTATVIATPSEGSGESGSIQIEIRSLDIATTTPAQMDGIEYQTYKFGNATWMVENSQAGTWRYDRYDSDPEKLGMYYSYANAPTACVAPWVLPTYQDLAYLIFYLNTVATPLERNLWVTPGSLTGRALNGTFSGWGVAGQFWGDTETNAENAAPALGVTGSTGTLSWSTMGVTVWACPVRCILPAD